MKTIVAGSRKGIRAEEVHSILDEHRMRWPITELVHGACMGVDTNADYWAGLNDIPVKAFEANWYPQGRAGALDRSAGPKRNTVMAAYGEVLVAIWDGQSKGTADMINKAKRKSLPVFIYEI